MAEPIHANCLAEVIGGVLGDKSPNLGLIVRVKRYVGDDPTYGRIWRCEAEYATSWASIDETAKTKPGTPGVLDFAQSWLRKIPDPKPPGEAITKTTDDEITA